MEVQDKTKFSFIIISLIGNTTAEKTYIKRYIENKCSQDIPIFIYIKYQLFLY